MINNYVCWIQIMKIHFSLLNKLLRRSLRYQLQWFFPVCLMLPSNLEMLVKMKQRNKDSQGLVQEISVVICYDTTEYRCRKQLRKTASLELSNGWSQVSFNPKRPFLSLKENMQLLQIYVYIYNNHLNALKRTYVWVYIYNFECVYMYKWIYTHVWVFCMKVLCRGIHSHGNIIYLKLVNLRS